MTVTLKNAENALKTAYLDVITERLDNASPFYAAIKKSTEFVTGKEARKLVVNSYNGGIGAGTEDGSLPVSGGNKYLQLTTSLKNLYGTIEISDKAIRAASTDTGAFVNLLNAEMEGLIKASSINFQRMLFNDGTARLGSVEEIVYENTLRVSDVNNFSEGMMVEIRQIGGGVFQNDRNYRVVESIDYYYGTVTLGGPAINSSAISIPCDLFHAGSYGNELTGLKKIFDEEIDELYGLKKSENTWVKPYVHFGSNELSEMEIQTVIDTIESRSGSTPNLIITTWGVRRVLQRLYSLGANRPDTIEIQGGFKGLNFNGIPIVVDRFCPKGTMYFLNTNDFELHQLCDWQWLEGDDGAILKQIPGKPVYTATLVKYADLMCSRPNAQGIIKYIEE